MSNLIDNRQIRVFISSTFQDMHDERDYLMKHTFPMLRKKASGRDVTLTELDLRWGITPEESESGKVVEICLREVENSIPFFVGIIGDRYGWVPGEDDLTENTKERFPQMKDYLERRLSVTEMEMQFGVLARKEDDLHAYFYIKEETTTAEKDNPVMLERLKEEVKKSKYPSSTYTSLEDLGSQVEQAFTSLLDRLFPEGNITELERERIGQRSFMRQLCQNYIPDDNNFKVLDDWMSDWQQHQLVVTGASGLGKSALIANWTNKKLNDPNRNYNIICHFTGNGGSQCDHEHILKVLADEIRDVYGWERDEDKNSGDKELDNLFVKVASEGGKPLLVILDAVNPIVDRNNAKLLNWLPVPPRNIKILFSTLEDDRTMEVFQNRRYPVFSLQPLNVEHRRRLVEEYLYKQYGKHLVDELVIRIVNARQCENTMVLKTLIDELAKFGVHEQLDSRIDYFLTQDTIEDFYQVLLKSYESDYGKSFVKHILSLIAVSKNGLSEDEIMKIAKIKRPFDWSSFFCSFITHFTVKSGSITFSHSFVNEAVKKRYLSYKRWTEKCRIEILDYRVKESNKISFFEVPYQLYMIGKKWSAKCLFKVISDPMTAAVLYNSEQFFLIRYWQQLKQYRYSMDCYLKKDFVLERMKDYTDYQQANFRLISLAKEMKEPDIAVKIAERGLNRMEEIGGVPPVFIAKCYNDVANACAEIDHSKAINYYIKVIELLKGTEELEYCVALNGIALLMINESRENAKELAIGLITKALDLCEKLYTKNHGEYAIYLNTLAQCYEAAGEKQKAIDTLKNSISILKNLKGERTSDLPVAYYNLAMLYRDDNKFNEAESMINKAIEINTKLMGKDFPDKQSYIELLNSIKRKPLKTIIDF